MAEVELINEEELNYGQEAEPVVKYTTCCVNVRVEPSKNSDISCTLEEGTEVHVVEEENGWSKHEFGWTMSEYLK